MHGIHRLFSHHTHVAWMTSWTHATAELIDSTEIAPWYMVSPPSFKINKISSKSVGPVAEQYLGLRLRRQQTQLLKRLSTNSAKL